MKAIVISYSLTGNNDALAASLAAALAAKHIRITEAKPRGVGAIALDMLFNRTPKVSLPAENIADYDLALFVGPVWMGQAASPLRAGFKQFGPNIGKYGFVSISGGADGPNPKLGDELKKRLGKAPAYVIDMHIADLLPADPKPTRDDTSNYRVTENDLKRLTEQVVGIIHGNS